MPNSSSLRICDLVADLLTHASSLLASKIVRDKPNSSSLPVCDQVADHVCDLDSVMECGLNEAKTRNPLKLAGVLQTGKPISAVSRPMFTML